VGCRYFVELVARWRHCGEQTQRTGVAVQDGRLSPDKLSKHLSSHDVAVHQPLCIGALSIYFRKNLKESRPPH